MVSSDHRKGRVLVCYTQYVAAMAQCTSERKMPTTYIIYTVVSLYYRMVVLATSLCDFTIPHSHFTQQYTVCAPAGSVSSVQSMTGNSRLHIALWPLQR